MASALPRRAAVYGAGIAGLTVAHELARRGWHVTVVESQQHSGGFFRSTRCADDRGMPSEYSWHGMGPWYHNVFDVLREIPHAGGGSLYDRVLSRPIDFGIGSDHGIAQFDDTGPVPDVRRMFRMTRLDTLRWAWLMLKAWIAQRRSVECYAELSAADAWRPLLSAPASTAWNACFSPWIGSDWTRVSLHTCGRFFCRQLTTRPRYAHPADADGPAWTHGARSGWLLLRGPSSEVWFRPWVDHLAALGVQFRFGRTLRRLQFDGGCIVAGELDAGGPVTADVHVLAVDPFAAADIVSRTPDLAAIDPLPRLRPLIQDGPHVQVSFRIAFAERIRWPRPRCALVLADSEFDLTLFAEEQAWAPDVDLGAAVASLWTATACVSRVPGRVHGRMLEQCTREQFIDEVTSQLLRCGALDALIREANGGRALASFAIVRFEIWHEWKFSPDGIHGSPPKWVTTTQTQPWQPPQRTAVPNLLLAGAHTRTDADVWSIEAAVESGRRAARVLEPGVVVRAQHRPRVLCWLGAVDDLLYAMHAPHVLTVMAWAVPLAVLAAAIAAMH